MRRKPPKDIELRGALQAEIMSSLWRLREATVEQVRVSLGSERALAYTTVQTVLSRLAERGLLTRSRQGNAFVYRARFEEGDHLACAVDERFAAASPDARRVALLHLLGGLDAGEIDELADHVEQLRQARRMSG